jgi:hypothetical protein
MAAVTRIRIIARPIENGSTTYTGFKKMHPQHEINQRLPPASGNDDGPSKMPAAQQRKILEQFANVYGAEIEFGGKKGHFFLYEKEALPSSFSVHSKRKKPSQVHVYLFAQEDSKASPEAALVVAIDVDHYRADLTKMAVREEQIRFRPVSVGEHA